MPNPLLRVLAGEALATPPVWLMRQAGRYLPEYREVRARAGGFLDLVYDPERAAEVTLQPIRRFGFDAAILFSDILVVPDALGQSVRFEEGEGPRLDPIPDAAGLARLKGEVDMARLAPVLETLRRVRAALPADTALLGFCGAPWTVATYMVAGRGTPDQAPARGFAYTDPEGFGQLIDRLTQASVTYLAAQVEAGADAVQLFDSWAGVLPTPEFRRWVIEPARRIVEGLRVRCPGARVIGFPRGAGTQLEAYAAAVPVDAIGLDTTVDGAWAARALQTRRPVQGNLDPLALLAGGEALDRGIEAVLSTLARGPLIFNLGHGILPQTPIAHVERMLRLVRG